MFQNNQLPDKAPTLHIMHLTELFPASSSPSECQTQNKQRIMNRESEKEIQFTKLPLSATRILMLFFFPCCFYDPSRYSYKTGQNLKSCATCQKTACVVYRWGQSGTLSLGPISDNWLELRKKCNNNKSIDTKTLQSFGVCNLYLDVRCTFLHVLSGLVTKNSYSIHLEQHKNDHVKTRSGLYTPDGNSSCQPDSSNASILESNLRGRNNNQTRWSVMLYHKRCYSLA